ncbi:GNAT family N-acetyltransferase [candidate division KSB1 bacterium]|nr:GNAT family N-acetyltransferase [candidate division KSB1 bacterium]
MKREISFDWFREWHPILDKALESLPEMDNCPHDLYKRLIKDDMGANKRVALAKKGDTPVALIGLKKRSDSWVPVTHYLLPNCFFPMDERHFRSILDDIRVNLWISWWRNDKSIPDCRYLRKIETIPTYRLDLTQDYESQWTKKQRKNVRAARNRCSNFTFAVNPPGSAEWIIKNSSEKWNENSDMRFLDVKNQLIAVKYLEMRDRHFSLILSDEDKFIAGSTLIVHGQDLVGQYMYRLHEYDKYGVGARLMDLTFSWAKEAGFKSIDMGGDYSDYKKNWAPIAGEKINVNICPPSKLLLKNLKTFLTSMNTRVGRFSAKFEF